MQRRRPARCFPLWWRGAGTEESACCRREDAGRGLVAMMVLARAGGVTGVCPEASGSTLNDGRREGKWAAEDSTLQRVTAMLASSSALGTTHGQTGNW